MSLLAPDIPCPVGSMNTATQNNIQPAMLRTEPLPEKGFEVSMKFSGVKKIANNPPALALSLGKVFHQMPGTGDVRRVVGAILNNVPKPEKMNELYQVMGGAIETDEGFMSVTQDAERQTLEIKVLTSIDTLADQIRQEICHVFDARFTNYNESLLDNYPEKYAVRHARTFQATYGKTEQTFEKSPDVPGKVGNFVMANMRGIKNMPQSVNQAVRLLAKALKVIDVTPLNISGSFSLDSANPAIKRIIVMAVVMESHLELRLIQEGEETFAYLSFFTCGDNKQPLPAAQYICDALQPDFAPGSFSDRGGQYSTHGAGVRMYDFKAGKCIDDYEIETIDYNLSRGEKWPFGNEGVSVD